MDFCFLFRIVFQGWFKLACGETLLPNQVFCYYTQWSCHTQSLLRSFFYHFLCTVAMENQIILCAWLNTKYFMVFEFQSFISLIFIWKKKSIVSELWMILYSWVKRIHACCCLFYISLMNENVDLLHTMLWCLSPADIEYLALISKVD